MDYNSEYDLKRKNRIENCHIVQSGIVNQYKCAFAKILFEDSLALFIVPYTDGLIVGVRNIG